MLTPRQDPGSAEVQWEQTRVTGGEPIPVRVSKKLRVEEGLITEYAGARLRMDLDRIPLWKEDHVGSKELYSYYAQYPYLSRLRDARVLAAAIENGVASLNWEQDTFAYADAWDDDAKRYKGLVAGGHARVLVDDASVVVKPAAARLQFDETPAPVLEPGAMPPSDSGSEADDAPASSPAVKMAQRFYGTKSLDPQRMSRDADQIAAEVVKHLVALVDANVEVKIEVSATVPSGVPEDVVRTVTENAKTLKFEQHGFEQS